MFGFSKCHREAKIFCIIGIYIDRPFLESYLTKYIKTFNYIQALCCLNINPAFIPNPAPQKYH